MDKEVILTGLRSNSEFHLGNYLGAILPMVELQKKHAGQYQLNMFIPDLHSFTTPIDHGKLYEQTHKNLEYFVAAGLDIDQPDTFIYRQSYIPAHSEMTWLLSCFSYFGELSRMTQFKDKAGLMVDQAHVTDHLTKTTVYEPNKIKDELEDHISVSAGLFTYPVLMAADILLYGARWVPVGDDQRQHVEFARDIAMRINNKFGDIFVLPADNNEQLKFSERNNPVRIRSLRNPEKKMSKSVEDPAGTIMLSDSPDDAAKKIMEATTDSGANIRFDFEAQPGISNLLQILALMSDKPQSEVNSEWEDKDNYGELKSAVAEAVKNFLTDLQTKLAAVDDQELMQKLEADEEAMRKIADATLLKVQKAVGLRPA
ncbi:tryptophan--tRNA ligase [bacterium G20]|nr:tryptophan--tRNA ligase [bacterium G20]